METRPKRPLSVWIAQILLLIFTLVFSASIVVAVVSLFGSGAAPNIGFLMAIVLNIGIVLAFLAGFWGMSQRKPYGRWIGVGMLSLMIVMSILGQIMQPDGPLKPYEYDNSMQRWSAGATQVVMGVLFLSLIAYLAFATRVTDFFTPPAEPVESIPPPPPSFD
ncbi:MAG: hypothetical protein KA956_14475 [Pyrinomonadaceae bacterium]|nr:hypothetical protein [Pyrinomonadaceae bacterium]